MIRTFLFGGPGTATTIGDVGLLVMRLLFGGLMAINHGWGKIYADGSIGPSAKFIGGVKNLGFPAPEFFAWMGAFTEFFGGILVAIGLCTRPAALFLCIMMSVAAFGQHRRDPLPVMEMALLYLGAFFLLLLIGGGRYALDSFFRRGRRVVLPKRSDQ
jgi:putative oxidoreductase